MLPIRQLFYQATAAALGVAFTLLTIAQSQTVVASMHTSNKPVTASEQSRSCNTSLRELYHNRSQLKISILTLPPPPKVNQQDAVATERQTFIKRMKSILGSDAILKRIRLTEHLRERGYLLIFVGTTKPNDENARFEALAIQSRTNCWLRVRASSPGSRIAPQQQLFHLMRLIDADEQTSNSSR